MRRLVIQGMVCAGLTLAFLGQSADRARAEVWYPWCAYYDPYTHNCGFVSLRQCLATAQGSGAICRPNPYPPPRARRR